MVRKPIEFLGKIYKTQGEFRTFVKNVIYKDIGICSDIKNKYPSHYITLLEILKRHPDFIHKTKNMSNIKILRDKLNTTALKTMIVNIDASEIDISWDCAITGKTKGGKYDLMSAMRSSIDEQKYHFKLSNEGPCVLCGNVDKLHVDHINYFDDIAYNFITIMEDEKINIPNNFGDTNDDTHRRCFLEIDSVFKNKWVDYHYKNASLRILCQKCNLTRAKSKLNK